MRCGKCFLVLNRFHEQAIQNNFGLMGFAVSLSYFYKLLLASFENRMIVME